MQKCCLCTVHTVECSALYEYSMKAGRAWKRLFIGKESQHYVHKLFNYGSYLGQGLQTSVPLHAQIGSTKQQQFLRKCLKAP